MLELARVAIPARVESFDPLKRTIEAQPLIQRPLPDGDVVSDPPLSDVPVVYPGTGKHRVLFPLATGDTVLLVFLDRASDDWALSLLLPEATSPKEKAPTDVRSHDYTDAVAIPLSTISTSLAAELASGLQPLSDRLIVQNGDAQLALVDGGKVALGKHGLPPVELLDQIVLALGVLEGTFPPLTAIKTAILSIKGTL